MNITELDPRICYVRILSSNILFDTTLPDRLELMADYYRESGADIIGAQEVNKAGTALFELLSDRYTAVATRHGNGNRCYTPIFFRSERFELIEGGCEVYRMRVNDTKSLAWAAYPTALCQCLRGEQEYWEFSFIIIISRASCIGATIFTIVVNPIQN